MQGGEGQLHSQATTQISFFCDVAARGSRVCFETMNLKALDPLKAHYHII